jgi:hypothetical protein
MSTQRVLAVRKPAPTGKRRRPAEVPGREVLWYEVFDPTGGIGPSGGSLAWLPGLDPKVSAPPEAARFFTVVDRRMEPSMHSGDLLLVRTDRKAVLGRPAVVKFRGHQPVIGMWYPRPRAAAVLPMNASYRNTLGRPSDVEWALQVLAILRFTMRTARPVPGSWVYSAGQPLAQPGRLSASQPRHVRQTRKAKEPATA